MSEKGCSNNKVIGLLSGNGSGKTTLAECLLFNSKSTERLGRVDEKNTVSDFSEMEKEKGFSISSSIMHYTWKDFNINIIDSPGYSDFIGQSQSTIKVSDSIIMVIDAKSGIQAPTEIILEQLREFPKPMFIVLNKMDLENIDFLKTVDEIKSMTPQARVTSAAILIDKQLSLEGKSAGSGGKVTVNMNFSNPNTPEPTVIIDNDENG